MKLYEKVKEPKIEIGEVVRIASDVDDGVSETVSIDEQIKEFNNHVSAFNSLNIIDEQISNENFNFIDKGNYILYNEYIKSITSNLNISHIPCISQETIETLPTTALNHHIALEGFIGTMWDKIKEIFRKIYESIKSFFKTYFTRLGRVKNKISNMIEVLEETDKDLVKPNLDKVPGSLSKKYPITGAIDSAVITETYNTIDILLNSFKDINNKADSFSNKDILDKNFVGKIVSLKNKASDNLNKVNDNKEEQEKLGSFKKHIPGTKDYSKDKSLNKENNSLEKEAKANIVESDKKTKEIDKITDKETDLDFEDKKSDEAKSEFLDFLKTLETILNSVKGKPLVGGKVITSIKVSEESGIEIDTTESKETPTGVKLDDKDTLIKLLKLVSEGINKSEKLTTLYGKINDRVMDNLNTVDKLINDIDKMPDESMGKYKKLLNNKIRVKLNLSKTFFNNYNKVCKNILDMSLDAADGVIEYSVLSLKHFG